VLDHFNGTSTGAVAGGMTYLPGINGLSQSASVAQGTYVKYQLTSTLENAATVELLLKPRQFGVGMLNFNWNNTSTPPSAGHVLHFGLSADGTISVGGWAWNSSCMYTLTSAAAVKLNVWNHVALSWGGQLTKVYVNGEVSGSSAQCFHPASPAWAYLNYWGGSDLGVVDEFQISDIQRTDAEMAAHASAIDHQ